ncbi:terminase small subunit [Staphylococcus aureus]|uniref:terminase small subunit n=1 Tax=Staphylococcus aureus TaxID=1280 RepID=UPI0038B2671D
MAEQQSILSEAASIELAKGILKLAEQIAQQKIEQQQRRWLTQTEVRKLYRCTHGDDYIQEQKKKVIDESVLSANELLHLLTNSAIGDETETKEVVVKRGEYKENPQNGKVQLVYNEYVQLVEVPIKPSDRLKARDMLGKYHKLFTERKEFTGDTPVIVNIGEWSEGDEEDTQRELDKIKENYPNRTMIVDNIPLED